MVITSLNTPHTDFPLESQHALDWLNFFLAALLTGVGPFVAVYLTERGWAPADVGFVLTVGGLAGLLTQVPAGELIDVAESKRAIVGTASGIVALALLVLGLRPDFPAVFVAAVMQGMAGSVLGPGIAAISLGLVGHDGLAERLGRNQRFASIGGLTTAAIMGLTGYLVSTRAIFFASAALWVPLLFALIRIHAADIHYGRSCGASDSHTKGAPRASRVVLFKDHRLLTFAVCIFMFQLGNASILPLLGERLVHVEGRSSTVVVSALILVPQIVVAALAPSVGRAADSWGRRPLFLIGLGMMPIRAALFALTADPTLAIVIQVLDGVSGATLGVLTALITADLTKGTGRYNLGQAIIGTLSAVGASLSTSMSGLVVNKFGDAAGFLSVTSIGLIAVAILLLFMPETKALAPRPKLGTG
jgi:MFS family permease